MSLTLGLLQRIYQIVKGVFRFMNYQLLHETFKHVENLLILKVLLDVLLVFKFSNFIHISIIKLS